MCRRVATESRCIVVSVEYRLAPENPYPSAVEDAISAYMWCQQNALSFGADPNKIAVGGDSAGGTLSAALTARLVEDNCALPSFQLLIYPSLDLTFSHPSVKQYGDGFFLTRSALDYYAKNYAKDKNLKDWRISPLYYDSFSKLPPAIILTADCDPIRDDGIAYSKKLENVGVRVSSKNVPGVIHAFMQLIDIFPVQTSDSYAWISAEMTKYWG